MSTYAVDGAKLTAIADAIRLKRDTTTDMTLDEMPLQIGLIDGGGGGSAEKMSGTFTPATQHRTATVALSTFPKIYRSNSILRIWKDGYRPTTSDTKYHVIDVTFTFSDTTFTLNLTSGYYKSTSHITFYDTSGNIKTTPVSGGVHYLAMRPSSNTAQASSIITITQKSTGWEFTTGNTDWVWDAIEYNYEWIYFGNNPEADIINF